MRECPLLQKDYGWLILVNQSIQPMNLSVDQEDERCPPLHIPIWLLVTVLYQKIGFILRVHPILHPLCALIA